MLLKWTLTHPKIINFGQVAMAKITFLISSGSKVRGLIWNGPFMLFHLPGYTYRKGNLNTLYWV